MGGLQPVNILLVDDHAHNLVVLKAALDGLDCGLVSANSGAGALKHLLAQDFAAVVLDIQMPLLDGFQTAALIHARDRSSSTPIIFLTEYDHPGVRLHKGYDVGAVDYLQTPFDPAVLRAKIAVFVELFRKNAALQQRTAELTRVTTQLRQHQHQAEALNALTSARSAELELASRHKSDFLTSMSHELRTPLNAIIGFSEIMLDHDDGELSTAQRRAYLDHIQQSGQHLLGLVNDILDLAKVEAGHMELRVMRVALEDILVGCVAVIRALADPKLLTLSTTCQPADALVTADPARLKQILFNLLSNAVKFTPSGGHIRLTANVDAVEATITVTDTGIGIRAEDQLLIFQPFRQVRADVAREQEGTGMGLPLVRELVELHGGCISLDSTPETGSCFTITLPHAHSSLALAAAPAAEGVALTL